MPFRLTSYGELSDDSLAHSIMNKYNIKGFPVLILLDEDGTVLFQKHGFRLNEDLLYDNTKNNRHIDSSEESIPRKEYHFNLEKFVQILTKYALLF